jgi:outer membrane biosynthesis protein TonB
LIAPARPAAGGTEAEAPKPAPRNPGWLNALMLLLSGLLGGFIAPHVGPDTPVSPPVAVTKPAPEPVTAPKPVPPPVVTTPKPTPAPKQDPPLAPQPPVVSSARKLLQFHNAERAKAGLCAPPWNDELEASRHRAGDLLRLHRGRDARLACGR